MDCTGSWTEKIVACKWTATNFQTTTHLSGHEPFESRLEVYSAHRRGAPGLEPICSDILHRSISPRVLFGAREAEQQHRSIPPTGENKEVMGQSGGLQISNGRRPMLRYSRPVGRHGRQGHIEKHACVI